MKDNNKKNINLNPKKIIIFLIILIIILICSFLYKILIYDQQEQKITAVKNNSSETSTTESTTNTEIDLNSYTLLLNKNSNPLDSTFVPSDLVDPENVTSTTGVFEVRQEVATQLQSMVQAAGNDGITLLVSLGYSSYEEQDQMYTTQVSLLKEAKASLACPKAGYSEHQLGLAVDFTDSTESNNQSSSFKDTDAYVWLVEHAHEYGFILRYPEDKESVTGYSYEPWHFRYVGVEDATAMHEQNLTMEEYYK